MKRTFVCRAGAALAMVAMLVLLAPRAEAARPPGLALRDAGSAVEATPAGAIWGRVWGWLSSLWGGAEGTDSYGGGQAGSGGSGEGGQGAAPNGHTGPGGDPTEAGSGIDPNG